MTGIGRRRITDVNTLAKVSPQVETGLEIMEQLRGFTFGMAIPTYIINAPGGFGKTPILPNYRIG